MKIKLLSNQHSIPNNYNNHNTENEENNDSLATDHDELMDKHL
jgi:hypothetical protein